MRAVDAWDQFYAGRAKPALRGGSRPKDMMPSLPAAIHRVDSADIAPSVADGSFGSRANKKAHPLATLKAAGWVSKDSSSVVIPKH